MATPAQMREKYRRIVHRYRNIPALHGLREYTITLVIKSYSGAHTGEGNEVELVTAITEAGGQPPKVRWLKDDEIAVGNLSAGTIEVGPITPEFSTGGADIAELLGEDMQTGETRHLRVTGPKHPNGALYRLLEVRADRAMHFNLRAAPVTAEI